MRRPFTNTYYLEDDDAELLAMILRDYLKELGVYDPDTSRLLRYLEDRGEEGRDPEGGM